MAAGFSTVKVSRRSGMQSLREKVKRRIRESEDTHVRSSAIMRVRETGW